jgi:hypothetical protein
MSTIPFPSLDLRGLQIRDQLLAIYHPGAWWFSIENALVNHTHPFKQVLQMILDQYEQAPSETLDVIPQETIDQIKALNITHGK